MESSLLDNLTTWPQFNAAADLLYTQILEFDLKSAEQPEIEQLEAQMTAWQRLVMLSDTLLISSTADESSENLRKLAHQNAQLVKATEAWRSELSNRLSEQLKTRSALDAYTAQN